MLSADFEKIGKLTLRTSKTSRSRRYWKWLSIVSTYQQKVLSYVHGNSFKIFIVTGGSQGFVRV